MLAYRAQDATMTLAEGLAEYYAAHPFLKRDTTLSPEGREFFRCHDAVHVVYGCDTSLPHEAVVKLSSFFGTTEGFRVLKGYALYDALDVYRTLKAGEVLFTMAAAFVLVPRTIWRCARQKARWPWSDFAAHMDKPLGRLRADFAIRVA